MPVKGKRFVKGNHVKDITDIAIFCRICYSEVVIDNLPWHFVVRCVANCHNVTMRRIG